MTINTNVRTAGPYAGNSLATVFSFAFEIFAATDLLVVSTNTSTGANTTLVLGTDYTVSLNANQNTSPGGSITMAVALATGYTMVMTSQVAPTQLVALTNGGGFFPTVINTALDRLTILNQQTQVQVNSSIQFPVADGTSLENVLPNAAQRALRTIVFDSSGNVAVSADLYVNQTAAAAVSAAAAAASASAASTSATNSANSATASAGSATAAAGSATAASGSATAAATSATNSATSATNSANSATASAASASAASTSASGASTSATNAAASATLASQWASQTSGIVAATDYSAKTWAIGGTGISDGAAKNWAQQTGADVTGAATYSRSAKSWAQDNLAGATYGGSAKDWAMSSSSPDGTNSSAKTYASNAATSATNSATSATASAASATSAAGSATTATTQASNASTYATNAANSATAAAASAAAAAASAGGFDLRGSVIAVDTAGQTGTYNNGASGVGATFTFTSTGVITFDTHALALNDQVLLTAQASSFQNGIYTVTTAGSAGVACVLTRRSDYNQSSEVFAGTATIVYGGSTYLNTLWVMTTTGTITMGAGTMAWAQINVTSAVTLTGDVTGSGTGTFATTIAASAVTTSKINNGAVTEAKFTFADNTTANMSTSAHGLMPKAVNTAGLYYDAQAGQTNPALNSVLTGYTSGAGTVSASDTILGAIQKLNGNIAAINIYGGATDGGSSGSNLVLTSSSNQAQGWTATTYGLSVQLPDATTLVAGRNFMIKNEGTYSFTVIDHAGNIRAILDAGESVTLWCMSISTAAGVWMSGNQLGTVNDLWNVNNQSSVTHTGAGASGALAISICPLTSTTGFMVYYDQTATAGWYGIVYTISGESITFGTRTSLQTQSLTTGAASSCVALSSTLVLVSISSNTSDTYVQAVSISGTTVTANTSLVVETAGTQSHFLFFVNSTTAYFAYAKHSASESAGVQITVSGTTCSKGSITYGAATLTSGFDTLAVCQLAVGTYFYAYAGASSFLCAQIFTNSAGTVTANTALTNQSNSVAQKGIMCCALSSTVALVTCNPTTSPAYFGAFTFTVSGTTPTLAQANIKAIPIQSTSTGESFALNVINPSSVIFSYADQAVGVNVLYQAGIKVDPINGDFTIEFERACALPAISANTWLSGGASTAYPAVGPATTLNGKYAIATINSSSSKPQLTYMNVVT